MNYEEKFAKAKVREVKKYRSRGIKLSFVYSMLAAIGIIALLLFCHNDNLNWYIALIGMVYFVALVFEFIRYKMDCKDMEINLWGKI